MQHVGRDISNEFALGDFERSPPHLFLYLFLFKRKTKVETTRTLPVLNTGESKHYSNKKWEVLEAPYFNFIFYYFLFFVKIIRATSRQCLVYGRKLDHGDSSCSCHGDVVPSFITIYGFIVVQAARLVHKYNNEHCIDIMISKTNYNHRKGCLWLETLRWS